MGSIGRNQACVLHFAAGSKMTIRISSLSSGVTPRMTGLLAVLSSMPQKATIASGVGFCTERVGFGLSIHSDGALTETVMSITFQAPLLFSRDCTAPRT